MKFVVICYSRNRKLVQLDFRCHVTIRNEGPLIATLCGNIGPLMHLLAQLTAGRATHENLFI